MRNLARNAVITMKNIKWGNAPKDCLRLQFGENPEVFPPALEALRNNIGAVNRYPDPEKIKLRSLLAQKENVSLENVFIGNGVDGLIELTAKVFCEAGDEVLIPSPTFPAYQAAVQLMGGTVVTCPLQNDFSLDFERFKKCITLKTKIIFLANPNNPTGNILFSMAQMEQLLNAFDGIVVVDEVYYEFAKVSALPLLKKYKNLIIFQSFSKAYGLAGLRIGVAFANEALLSFFHKAEGSSQVFAINSLGIKAAESVLENQALADKFVEHFLRQKKLFESKLVEIEGLEVFRTQTSFCIFAVPGTAEAFRNRLLEKHVAVKSMSLFDNISPNLVCCAVPPEDKIDFVIKRITQSIEGEEHVA